MSLPWGTHLGPPNQASPAFPPMAPCVCPLTTQGSLPTVIAWHSRLCPSGSVGRSEGCRLVRPAHLSLGLYSILPTSHEANTHEAHTAPCTRNPAVNERDDNSCFHGSLLPWVREGLGWNEEEVDLKRKCSGQRNSICKGPGVKRKM